MLLLQVRKQERMCKQSADEHASAALALEAKLAGKQREVADLQELNSSLFSRFQAMRSQLVRTEEKLSHDKLKGGCCCIAVCTNKCALFFYVPTLWMCCYPTRDHEDVVSLVRTAWTCQPMQQDPSNLSLSNAASRAACVHMHVDTLSDNLSCYQCLA